MFGFTDDLHEEISVLKARVKELEAEYSVVNKNALRILEDRDALRTKLTAAREIVDTAHKVTGDDGGISYICVHGKYDALRELLADDAQGTTVATETAILDSTWQTHPCFEAILESGRTEGNNFKWAHDIVSKWSPEKRAHNKSGVPRPHYEKPEADA